MKKRWNTRKFLVHGLGFFLARVGMFGLYPFIMPYYAAVYRERMSGKIAFFALLAGVATGMDKEAVVRYGLTMVTVLLAAKMAEGKGDKLSVPVMGLMSGIITAAVYAGGSFFHIGSGGQQWVLGILEGVFVFVGTIVIHKGVYYALYNAPEKKPDQMELISLSVLALAFVYGLPEFRQGQISFVYPLLNLAVLTAAYRFGAGAGTMMGALTGAVVGFQTGQMELVGCFCLLGMLAGILQEIGRLPTTVAYLLGSLAVGFLWSDFFIGTAGLKGTLPAVILFPLLPRSWFSGKVKTEGPEETAISNMQLVMREKVREMALGFRRLAEVMDYQMEPRHALSGGELNHIFNGVSEHCCGECVKKNVCLKSDFQDTYHVVFRMLNAAQKRGKVVNEDVPLNFTERCMQVQEFVAEANRELQIARVNLQWQNRLAESREVVAGQFMGLAGMMEEFAAGVSLAMQKKNGKEEQIRARMQAAGLEVSQVAVLKRPDDRSEVYMTLRVRGGGCITTKEVAAALEEVMGKSFHPSIRAKTVVSKDWNTITLVEDTAFHFYSGIASCNRDGENWSGDSHSIMNLPDGNAVLLLSDGMGSGKRASEESNRVVELLEQFLEAGMDPESAVKMIHSSMLMRKEEESFSTIDLCLVDLCSGLGKFVKIGAAPAYRIRDGELEKISSISLPVGMVSQMEVEDITVRLKKGDFLIMATDGFYEQFERGEENGADIDTILRSVVGDRNGNNAAELARKLLDTALIHSGGCPTDDITVLVAGFWG